MRLYLLSCLGGISLLLGSCFNSSSNEFVRLYEEKKYNDSFVYLNRLNTIFFAYDNIYNNLGTQLIVDIYGKNIRQEKIQRIQDEIIFQDYMMERKRSFFGRDSDTLFLSEALNLIPILSSGYNIWLLEYDDFKIQYENMLTHYKKSTLYQKDSLLYYNLQLILKYQLEYLRVNRPKNLLSSYSMNLIKGKFGTMQLVHDTMKNKNFFYHPDYTYYLKHYDVYVKMYQGYLEDMRKTLKKAGTCDGEEDLKKQLKDLYKSSIEHFYTLESPCDSLGNRSLDIDQVKKEEKKRHLLYFQKK